MARRWWVWALAALAVLAIPAAANASILSFSVTSHIDETTSGDGCSLREAISAANAGAGTSDCPGTPSATMVVNVPLGIYPLSITPNGPDDNNSGDLTITNTTNNITIEGAGARTTIIDGEGIDRVLTVAAGVTATIADVTIMGGRAPDTPALPNGGGILNFGALTISNSTISGNHSGNGADNPCGGCSAQSAGGGGGISNYGAMTALPPMQTGSLQLLSSTVTGNTTGHGGNAPIGTAGAGGQGAGIESLRPLTVTNSTITGNTTGNGGTGPIGGSIGGNGAGVFSGGPVTVTNSTIAGNGVGTGANSNGHVGGVDQGNFSFTLTNTLVASNAAGNCGGTIGDGGHNLSFPASDTSCPGTFLTGDPALGALANNGGSTDTMALGAGSAAIDQVPVTGASCPALDQRGVTRPQGPLCDIGAFERALPPPPPPAPPTLAPSSLTFPLAAGTTQPQGTIGPAQTLTLTRPNGAGASTVTGVTVTGIGATDFLISNDGCTGTQLTGTGASSSCQVSIRFAPATQGTETALISISDTNGTTPTTQTATLSGRGGAPAVSPPLIALFFAPRYQTLAGHTVRLFYFSTRTATVMITIRRRRKVIAVLHQDANPGRNAIKWSERAGGKAQRPGRYLIDLQATAGGQTATDHAQLLIVKAPVRHHRRHAHRDGAPR